MSGTTKPRRKPAASSREVGGNGSSRAFRLTSVPGKGETFGVTITEAYGEGSGPTTASQTGRVLDVVIQAIKDTGHTAGRLSTERGTPIPLDEVAGVRLSLTLMATQPLTNHDRIREIVSGIAYMSVEETYYWYAKCVGPDHARARKAIRVLLADDKTGK